MDSRCQLLAKECALSTGKLQLVTMEISKIIFQLSIYLLLLEIGVDVGTVVYELLREKTCFFICKKKAQISRAVTTQLFNAFVSATKIVQSLFFLCPKFQGSNHLLCLYILVCVGPGWKP